MACPVNLLIDQHAPICDSTPLFLIELLRDLLKKWNVKRALCIMHFNVHFKKSAKGHNAFANAHNCINNWFEISRATGE